HYLFPLQDKDKNKEMKFQGGREASGVLKGFDHLLYLVLDGTIECIEWLIYTFILPPQQLGLAVCRGTSVVLICPQDGLETIPKAPSYSRRASW
uniref:Sm domain-containing protein n=1 Tax=Hucho hucho TaxID=62062 RepID=A0A4W5Q7M2_9TELE